MSALPLKADITERGHRCCGPGPGGDQSNSTILSGARQNQGESSPNFVNAVLRSWDAQNVVA